MLRAEVFFGDEALINQAINVGAHNVRKLNRDHPHLGG